MTSAALRRPHWLGGSLASVALHAGAAAAVLWAIAPVPFTPQQMPEARLDIAGYEVDRTAALPAAAPTEPATEAAAEGSHASATAVPEVVARPAALPADAVASAPATGKTLAGADATAPVQPSASLAATALAALPSSGAVLAGTASPAAAQTPLPLPVDSMAASAPPALPLAEIIAPVEVAGPVAAAAQQLASALPDASQPIPVAAPAATAATSPAGPALALAAPEATALADVSAAASPPSAAVTLPSERGRAELAWSGDGAAVDPVSLAAIAAFMQPGDLAASGSNLGELRDGLALTLASVPCARLQTRFVPETGSLELRGHIPEEALRAPVLAALRAQVGSAIPVTDQVLILPRPQCGALAGIAALGLPQSTDQLTNPRVVGPDAHVREYHFTGGQRLSFDLTAPDYDSVIYIDYFDADGMVVHLQPNEMVALAPAAAASPMAIGRDMPGKPGLNVAVGPPYGQDIAVAFAASVPLYDGLRPIREPAAPYLEFLRDRVAAARATHPGFKGEWVYFFITTRAP